MKHKTDSRIAIKNDIVTGILLDRDFDVPVTVYDELNSDVVIGILKHLLTTLSPVEFINKYNRNTGLQTIFSYTRFIMSRREHRKVISRLKDIIPIEYETEDIALLLVYNKTDWNREKISIFSTSASIQIKWLYHMMMVALKYPELEFQYSNIYNTIPRECKANNYAATNILSYVKNEAPLRYVVTLAYTIGANESYKKTKICLSYGIPVLYHEYDEECVAEYLECILENGYNGLLDIKMEEFIILRLMSSDTADLKTLGEHLLEIGTTLNQGNLKYYYMLENRVENNTRELIRILSVPNLECNTYGHKLSAAGWLTDFGDLVKMMGRNGAGYSIDIQRLFLDRHGDIETMFDKDGKLLDEASILRSPDQLSYVMNHLSTNDLRFLLLNSPEFVKNIMLSKNMTVDQYIHIARALLIDPIDEELWKLINEESSKDDYRVHLINRISTSITKEVMFKNVPESMMYLEPDVLYISRNITAAELPYVPAHKAIPYLRTYIAQRNYAKLNLYCKGEYVTLPSAIGDPRFVLMDTIVKSGKYGYICDLTLQPLEIPELIERVTDLVQERRNK